MPTFRHGKNSRIFYGGYELSTFLRSINFPRTVDMAETTAFTSTAKTYLPGMSGSTLSVEGMFCYSAGAAEFDNIVNSYIALETPIPVAWAPDGGVAVGKLIYGGLSHQTTVNISGSVSDVVGMNVDFQLSDSAGDSYILRDPTSALALTGVASAGTEVLYDNLRQGANTNFPKGGIFNVHVLANTVNNTTTMHLESRIGAGAYTSAGSVSIPASTIGWYSFSTTSAVEDGIRYNITATGTGNLTFLCYFVPRLAG